MQEPRQRPPNRPDPTALYPFLFALYPVLFLYLRNVREVLPLQALAALGVSLLVALLAWMLTRLLVGHAGKRSLLLFLFLLFFHGYGVYFAAIAGWLPVASRPILAHGLALVLPFGIWFVLSWVVVRSGRDCQRLNQVLGLAVALLVLWNLLGILMHLSRAAVNPQPPQLEVRHGAKDRAAAPDIYCFILDEFASLESAQSRFQYANAALADTLRRQGFFIAKNSRSRFWLTEPAMADILNLGEWPAKADPFPLIRRNAVASFLTQRGYRIIEFPVQPVLFMEAADLRFHYSLTRASIFFNDFYRTLLENTVLRFLPDLWRRQKTDFTRFYRQRVLHVFDKLPALIKSPGPKFIFAHVYCPHEPFVFNAQGGMVDAAHAWDHDDPRFYLEQYMFISSKITETTALILRDSATPPVIIIQSDHGYRGSLRRGKQPQRVPRDEMVRVFNALYLPRVAVEQIDPALSPLNNFRLVFNHFFSEHYPLLENP